MIGNYITFHFRNGVNVKIIFTNRDFAKEKVAEIDEEFGVKKIH